MAESPNPFQTTNPIVERLLAGTAPAPIKLAAARGALPISAEEQFHVLPILALETDEAVAAALKETIEGLSDDALSGLLRSHAATPGMLLFYAAHVLAKPHSVAAIITHRAVEDDTLDLIAARGTSDALELIVTNQVRLIRAPQLIDTVLANPHTSPDQRRRILEVREEFFVKKEREEKRRKDEEDRLAKLREKKEWTQQELEKLQEELAKEAQADAHTGALIEEAEDEEDSDDASRGAYARILSMSVPERILLAIRGSRTERNLLIKDSNRLVATAVIRSPKLNDKDVELFAGSRNVSDEILRYIGNRREWLKSYNIVLTLVKNPRTPLAVSINLLQRVQARDLKNLESDRNVAESLRRQAKAIIDRAAKKAGSH